MSATYLAALQAFDAESFARRHGGYKESRNRHSHESLETAAEVLDGRIELPPASTW